MLLELANLPGQQCQHKLAATAADFKQFNCFENRQRTLENVAIATRVAREIKQLIEWKSSLIRILLLEEI